MAVMIRSAPYGSSPHTRGTPLAEHFADLGVRFIPACAGNADSLRGSLHPPSVHPRMRGERGSAGIGALIFYGSSPHARGTPPHPFPIEPGPRFIPACAGNASRLSRAPSCCTVHPRMRGERGYCGALWTSITGSSPHARGTPCRTHYSGNSSRFIPACAGNALPVSY